MKLLVVTQVMDEQDPVLGFFVGWVEGLAARFKQVEVICLKEGAHALPANVRVHSLGKEKGRRSRLAYAARFFRLAWRLRNEYDTVFVHMNQEYIVMAGWLWKLLGKRVYMWRNHYAGSAWTGIAAAYCTKVFCTSRYSYTARYRRTVLMPVGVDLDRFTAEQSESRKPHSILFFSRISPSKRPDMFVEALGLLIARGVSFTASMYGSPLPEDERYYDSLKLRADELGLHDRLRFHNGVPNADAPRIFHAHEIFVNCSPSGMFDKTLFEAAASGCTVLAASDDFAEEAGKAAQFDSAESLADRLKDAIGHSVQQDGASLAAQNSLDTLVTELSGEIRERPAGLRGTVWKTLHALARALPHRARATVLLYHSISDSDEFFAVSPRAFDRQMRYLAERNEPISLSRAFAHARGEKVKRDSVAVTFDDGYRDFATDALPILKRYGIPATVFVLGDAPDRAQLGNDHSLLTAADAQAVRDPLVRIGSHGISHKKLTKLPVTEAMAELEESRAAIEKRYGTVPAYLAYPKGSLNEVVKDAARAAGFEGAVSVIERSVREGDDLYALPRIQIDARTTQAVFEAKLSPAADWYYRLWSAARRLRG